MPDKCNVPNDCALGVILPNGTFRAYPKQSLLNSGITEWPAEIIRPDGLALWIVPDPNYKSAG